MSKNRTAIIGSLSLALVLFLLAASLLAQQNRISKAVDNRQRVVLAGHIHPLAKAEDDQGPVDPSMPLPYVTLTLKRSVSQQAALDRLLAEQQDPSSPNYRHWLTPEQYADRFGVSQGDLDQIVAWLKQQNLSVVATARSRTWVAFSGTAGQVQSAFGTQIHHYLVDGKMHYANATEPTIPAAFADVVDGIHGLADFRLHPPAHAVRSLQPKYDSSRGVHNLAPDDLAVIYNIQPLLNAGIDGTGQQMVVVGQTQIQLADIEQFHRTFNLPGGDPKVVLVPNTRDPGISSSDLPEADLDLEWASAVARKAAITFVYSENVMDAAQYAIDQNLAPVLSMSYGACEAQYAPSDARTLQSWAVQANAQGMTWLAPSGDNGAADCFDPTARSAFGLAVDMPASIPQVTGVGATEFVEGTGNYWSSTNSANLASALSYIPETAWNDSAEESSAAGVNTPDASGGGASTFFAKPSWQAGAGVPGDGARDVPDIAVSGSNDHDGYIVYTGGAQEIIGGTSVGAPVFGGITVLLNHYQVAQGFQSAPGQGNINPRLYNLAQTTPSAFHDITTGSNIVNPCPPRARGCTASPIGYNAGPGYDQVTGLGSPDVYTLVAAWNTSASPRATAAMSVSSSAGSILISGSTVVTATVRGSGGVTPTGSVTFSAGGAALGTVTLSGSGGAATAGLTVEGSQLAIGNDTIAAQYSGDGSYFGASASVTLVVTAAPSGPTSIGGLTNGASFQQAYAPGMILSVFGSQLAPIAMSASAVPLPGSLAGVSATINGVTAPLYYISPGQLNIQIPYETGANSTATLTVDNNGQTASASFHVAAAAPGIFADQNGAPVPYPSAARGQIITVYMTGDGPVSPPLATGAAPASGTPVGNLPKPAQAVTVTVGGVTASIQFIGIPSGLVGVTQINFQVPPVVTPGSVPVVVTVGGVASPPVNLSVTN